MIVLDTHAWLWWLHQPKEIKAKTRRLIERKAKANEVLVSAISVWEIALKVSLNKLWLPMDLDQWLESAKLYHGLEIAPVGAEDALESTRLPGNFHQDPADRIIVALARRYGAVLVTRDHKIRTYSHVRSIW